MKKSVFVAWEEEQMDNCEEKGEVIEVISQEKLHI